MPRCAACPNRSGKGVKVSNFPRDEVVRNTWIQALNKKNWTPTKYAVLCELHFAPEMWEKVREDGRKKLKRNAVPTIFNRATGLVEDDTPSQEYRMEHKGTRIDKMTPVVEDDNPDQNISVVPSIKIENEENQDEPEAERKEVELETEMNRKVSENCNSEEELEQEKDLESLPQDCERKILGSHPNYQQLKKMYEKSENLRTIMKKKHKETIRKLQRRIKRLEQEVRVNDQRTSHIKKLLNDDQVEVLNRQMKKVCKWSDATLVAGYKLKFSCGNTGYTTLIKEGWPLPSIRTLRRKVENWK
ncbi:THAP domain-containing protein 1 [Cephus cinctus]|uniref:THAP domain-containing protein 1 n=1 Tax=Cephus cinctus TaxID=211228 RepID=A0AAJ7FS92_CEPCN|nr:THAP domain-containing protein 1 [Cephus cinctus]